MTEIEAKTPGTGITVLQLVGVLLLAWACSAWEIGNVAVNLGAAALAIAIVMFATVISNIHRPRALKEKLLAYGALSLVGLAALPGQQIHVSVDLDLSIRFAVGLGGALLLALAGISAFAGKTGYAIKVVVSRTLFIVMVAAITAAATRYWFGDYKVTPFLIILNALAIIVSNVLNHRPAAAKA